MSTPVTLAIDTARERLQLALVLSNGAIETEILDIAKGHAEIIFGAIGTLLDRCGLTYQSLNRIAVSTGPGSFTGLRIGTTGMLHIALGQPRDKAELVDLKQILQVAARTTPDDPMIDIGLMAGFASRARPKDFPPDPTYIRAADAKPQAGFGVARR